MSLPIREQILQALALRLDALRGLEGYDLSELPITILVEGADEAQETDYDMTRVAMPVTIARAVAKTGLKNDIWYEDANVEMAQMIVDAFGTDETFGGLAQGMEYAGGEVGVLTDGAQGYTAQISLIIRYAFLHGNPFTAEEEA
jgi:hypothetical protein